MGLVGYFYQQVTGDSGSGATLGEFKSRVVGIGPQVAKNRPDGWNVWLSLLIPLSSAKK